MCSADIEWPLKDRGYDVDRTVFCAFLAISCPINFRAFPPPPLVGKAFSPKPHTGGVFPVQGLSALSSIVGFLSVNNRKVLWAALLPILYISFSDRSIAVRPEYDVRSTPLWIVGSIGQPPLYFSKPTILRVLGNHNKLRLCS